MLEEEPIVKQLRQEFEDAMNDDFNTPKAIAVLHKIAKELNKERAKILNKDLMGSVILRIEEALQCGLKGDSI